jgi:hypothetical protein
MSSSPSAHVVDHVQRLIQETFDVSENDAKDHAVGLVLLAEGWGTPETAANINWTYRVRKHLGKTLKWRSEEVRQEFEAMQKQKVKAYELLIDQNKTRGRMPI